MTLTRLVSLSRTPVPDQPDFAGTMTGKINPYEYDDTLGLDMSNDIPAP